MSTKIPLSNTKIRHLMRRYGNLPAPKDITFSLTVANLEQKLIFLYEMKYQISDGWWDESEYIMTALPNEVEPSLFFNWDNVKINPDKIGIHKDLKFAKNNYNFSSRQLLKQIGNRIRFKIALTKAILAVKPYSQLETVITEIMPLLPEDGLEYMEWKAEGSTKFTALCYAGISESMVVDVQRNLDEIYSMTDLRHDCKTLKMCFRRVK